MITCTRRLEFDAAHRVLRHESKCAHLHGHRYAVEITCHAPLDDVGRVIDFGLVKERVGGWIDAMWDHGTLVNVDDFELLSWLTQQGQKRYIIHGEPTAENIASMILERTQQLLGGDGLTVVRVRVYETPNCWADAWLPGFVPQEFGPSPDDEVLP